MTEEAILKKMAEMLLENNKRLMSAVDASIEKAITKAVRESEERMIEKIEISQKDTIDTLSELIHTGYDLHENRIQRIEEELKLSPLKNN